MASLRGHKSMIATAQTGPAEAKATAVAPKKYRRTGDSNPLKASFDLGGSQQEFRRREQQNLATGLNQSALLLPLADQPAGGEMRDIGSLGQLFIGDIQFHALGDIASNPLGQVDEDGSDPLRRGVAGERPLAWHIEREVLCSRVQRVIK